METWTIWIIAAIIFAIIEIYTPSFFIIWFSAGSLAAAATSVFCKNPIIQIIVFALVSLIFILSTKKLTDKFINKKKAYKTNSDSLIGKSAKIIEAIDPIEGKGRAKVGGESWKATSKNNEKIEEGETVKIVKIDGVTLIVEK